MEASNSPFPCFGSNRNQAAEKLARAHLNLKAAILKYSQKRIPKRTLSTDEEELDCLQEQIRLLCGDGFRLTWSTEESLRLLWTQKQLRARTPAMDSFCKRHLRMKDCPSPWQLLLHCDWLGAEDHRSATFKYLLNHFKEAVLDTSFQKIPSSILEEFLSDPGLVIDREVDAVRGLLRWLHVLPTQRASAASNLIRFVHVERLSREELREVEAVFRYLTLQSSVSQTFQRRQVRLQTWVKNMGVKMQLSLTRGAMVEVSELNVHWRRWDIRRTFRQSSFQCETLTGDHRNLVLVGDDDLALLFRRDKVSPESINLCPEFLGPVAYRLVLGVLYAVQNLGWKLCIWSWKSRSWTLLATRPASTWLYGIQLFANQDYLVIAGRRDCRARTATPSGVRSGTIVADLFGKKEPCVWTYNVNTRRFTVLPRFDGPNGRVQNLGATSSAFWVAHCTTGEIWMADLMRNVWKETSLKFPVDDKVLCSTCCGSYMLVLSCNIRRGTYLTLSTLFQDTEPYLAIIGSLSFEFPKSYAQDFVGNARFHVCSEKLICF